MAKPSKMFIVRVIVGVLLIGGVGAASVAGFYLGERSSNESSAEEQGSVRRSITITETEDGKILFDGKPLAELAQPLNIPRPFFDEIPTDCEGVTTVLREIMAGKETAADLDLTERGTFELMHYLSRDLCSYEAYRSFLTTDLFDFMYSSGGELIGATAVGGVEAGDEAVNSTVPSEEGK